jgi:hypothetical protein
MRSIFSFLALLLIKGISNLLFKFKIGWPDNNPNVPWKEIRLIVFLNHTSLLEPVYLGFLPISFLRMLSKRLIAPGADKTLNRPIVGFLYKLLSPQIIPITRKRDDSWSNFMNTLSPDSIIAIAPEGRMKRRNGLDLNGEKMTVRGGVADVLECLHEGKMAIAYSGGLHHVHAPDESSYHVFKTLKMNLELLDIAEHKASFAAAEGSEEWRKLLIADLQHRLETKVPEL